MNCNSILNGIEIFFIDFISNLKSCICIESDKEIPIQQSSITKNEIYINNQENQENESNKKCDIDNEWVRVTY